MEARRRASVLSAIPFLAALLLLSAAHVRLRRTWRAEIALRSSINSINQGEFQRARQQLGAALQLDPNNAHYHSHLAILQERTLGRGIEPFTPERPTFDEDQLKHLRAAVQSYETTLRLNPSDDAAYHNLGWLNWFMGQNEQAIECVQKAIELDGTSYLYHISLGLLRELREDKAAAFSQYGTALYLSPGLLDSRFFRDLRRRWPEEVEGLIASTTLKLEAKLRDRFDPLVAAKLGRLYMQRQPDRALALLDAATRALPNLSRPWANLGRLYQLHGDKSWMRECYEKSVFIDGSDTLSWYRLGGYYEELNRTQDAARCYERAVNISLNPDSSHSGRVRRIYLSRYTLFDDVIPRGLLSYTGANINLPAACRRLSEIYLAAGDEERARHFAELGQKYALEIDFSSDEL